MPDGIGLSSATPTEACHAEALAPGLSRDRRNFTPKGGDAFGRASRENRRAFARFGSIRFYIRLLNRHARVARLRGQSNSRLSAGKKDLSNLGCKAVARRIISDQLNLFSGTDTET